MQNNQSFCFMEYRQLGNSGLMVSAMSLGTMTFGGKNKFAEVGTVGVDEAREAEYELLPIGVDQRLGALIWSPLAGALLSGKYSRDNIRNVKGRFANGWDESPVEESERLNTVSRPQLLYPYWHQSRFIRSRMGTADHILLDSY